MREMISGDVTGLDDGSYAVARAYIFTLPSATYGFWTGSGDLNVNGVICKGSGSLLELISLGADMGIDATQVKMRLRAVPDTDLTPDVMATIEAENYKGSATSIYLLIFYPVTGTLVRTYRQWRGFIDTIDHEGTTNGDYSMVANLESKALDHARTGVRSRTEADQHLLDPTDGFFKHIAVAGEQTIYFGRATPAPARSASTGPQGRQEQ